PGAPGDHKRRDRVSEADRRSEPGRTAPRPGWIHLDQRLDRCGDADRAGPFARPPQPALAFQYHPTKLPVVAARRAALAQTRPRRRPCPAPQRPPPGVLLPAIVQLGRGTAVAGNSEWSLPTWLPPSYGPSGLAAPPGRTRRAPAARGRHRSGPRLICNVPAPTAGCRARPAPAPGAPAPAARKP